MNYFQSKLYHLWKIKKGIKFVLKAEQKMAIELYFDKRIFLPFYHQATERVLFLLTAFQK